MNSQVILDDSLSGTRYLLILTDQTNYNQFAYSHSFQVTDEAEIKKYDATMNSAQKLPGRQG